MALLPFFVNQLIGNFSLANTDKKPNAFEQQQQQPQQQPPQQQPQPQQPQQQQPQQQPQFTTNDQYIQHLVEQQVFQIAINVSQMCKYYKLPNLSKCFARYGSVRLRLCPFFR